MDAFLHYLTEWGYIGMFISAFLAGTILPFSSEAVLLACIGLGLDPVWSTISTTAGNALGGLTCYWIGHLGKMGERCLDGTVFFSARHRRRYPHRTRADAGTYRYCHRLYDLRQTGTVCPAGSRCSGTYSSILTFSSTTELL